MKLSVLMITYNHEEYISQALDSILMQEVNFAYEIVIGEDFSTDNTRKIVMKYQEDHPRKIKLLLPDKNLGMHKNFVDTFFACQGEYVALLEGDDYWSSTFKLQKQVDFLDSHPECTICFHSVKVISEEDLSAHFVIPVDYKKQISTIKDLVVNNFIPSCSTVFRKGLFESFPDWFFTLNQGDWSLHLLNAQHGHIGYLDEEMAVYRLHSGGVWTGARATKRVEAMIATYQVFNEHLHGKYDNIIKPKVSEYYYEMAMLHEARGELNEARKFLIKCIVTSFPKISVRFYVLFVIIIKVYFPWLYKVIVQMQNKLK